MNEPDWRMGFCSLETEHVTPVALEVAGQIPEEVFGTLYRNGPARFDVFGERVANWFDGDGMVHAMTLSKGGVHYRNRFVQSAGHCEENAARRRIHARFAMPPAGGFLRRWLHRKGGHTAPNTSVRLHAGVLRAMYEGGWPERLHPVTLETLGEDDLGGLLAPDECCSAHPRFDAETGELWNFTLRFGPKPCASVARTDAQGRTARVAEFPMPTPSMVHDFGLTRRYAVVKFDPYVLPRVPLGLMLGQRSFGQSLSWRPELGGKIALVPRGGGVARIVDMDARFAVHVIHAFDDGDDVVLDVLSYPDDGVMRALHEAVAGPITTPASSFPERIRIAPSGRARIARLGDVPMELPLHLAEVGRPERFVWGVAWKDPLAMMGTPARLDVETGRTELAPMGPGEYAGECVPVRKRGATSDAEAWLLTLVLDSARKRTELRVLDGANLMAPPVARAVLPHAVPFGFHGSFASADEVARAAQARA